MSKDKNIEEALASLWNMKEFYQTFLDFKRFSTHCVENLSWANTRLIIKPKIKKFSNSVNSDSCR